MIPGVSLEKEMLQVLLSVDAASNVLGSAVIRVNDR